VTLKRINESPTISDTIIFDILTPDVSGCYLNNPVSVNKITIYYVTRDFGYNTQQFDNYDSDADLLKAYETAKAIWCASPTPANLAKVDRLYNQLEASTQTNSYYYKEAVVVAVFGTDTSLVWQDTGNPAEDASTALQWHFKNIDEDENEDLQYGHWELEWSPNIGQREGDYVICWSWTPAIGAEALSDYQYFSLSGDTRSTTSIPTHFTKENKYETLLNRYLPSLFATHWSNNDLSPEILQELNNSVAKGFTLLEDLTNQSVDLFDANAINEAYLAYLANLFSLKLRSGDSTLWRRQIKRAVPVFKKKGTYKGLSEALAQAGIELKKFTKLWQVVSPYTWQELFNVTYDGQDTFTLSKTAILPIDLANFELYYRGANDDNWTTLTIDYVQITNASSTSTLTWVGNLLSFYPITLQAGDSIRVVYQTKNIPAQTCDGLSEQDIETYIRGLSLADQRDERSQDYPLKNWNVRLIEEDDLLFDCVIPTRHPYYDPLIFGLVRTEFPYSENIYNMEEYNGSTRESRSPCDIDRDFIDPCSGGQGSKYIVDLRIEQLCDDRIREALEILDEYTPFHAVLHQMNFEGLINEFLSPPTELVEMLVHFSGTDLTISGNGQMFFNRVLESPASFRRDSLATGALVAGPWIAATGYNDSIVVFSPDAEFWGMNEGDSTKNILEIMIPSISAGTYTCNGSHSNQAVINGMAEPFTTSSFNFRLSLDKYTNTSIDIVQEFTFDDAGTDFRDLWNATNPATVYDGSWTIDIPAYSPSTYNIIAITSDGELLINDYAYPLSTLPTINTTGITYTIYSGLTTIATGTAGRWTKTSRGIVDFSSEGSLDDVRHLFSRGQYVLYGGTQYEIVDFVPNDVDRLYIGGYTSGDVTTATIHVYQRLLDNQMGYLQYKDMMLRTTANYESATPPGFGILNGANAPVDPDLILDSDLWKESFLVVIQNPPDNDYYAIAQIDGNTITLSGVHKDWGTWDGITKFGTAVNINIYQYTKESFTIPERDYPPMDAQTFPSGNTPPLPLPYWSGGVLVPPVVAIPPGGVDHGGNDAIGITAETATPFLPLLAAMPGNEISEPIGQNESISFSIEYKDK
jgi:hypothetical protein